MEVGSGCGLQQRRRLADSKVDLMEVHCGEPPHKNRSKDSSVNRAPTMVRAPGECRCEGSVGNHRVPTAASTPDECRCGSSTSPYGSKAK